jgi:hypothetical protein
MLSLVNEKFFYYGKTMLSTKDFFLVRKTMKKKWREQGRFYCLISTCFLIEKFWNIKNKKLNLKI